MIVSRGTFNGAFMGHNEACKIIFIFLLTVDVECGIIKMWTGNTTWNIRTMKGAIKMYNVYMTTGFYGVKRLLTSFYTYEEAAAFCVENNWEYIDENEFQWGLDIE